MNGPDTTSRPETIEWHGVVYRLMGGGRTGERRYYLSQSTSNMGRKGAKGLHVAVWEFFSGQKVPPAHHVHHRDENTFNNVYENLELLSIVTHRGRHPATEKARQHLEAMRPLAAEWHKSPEGREWHRKMAASYERKRHEQHCIECGEPFMAAQTRARYCSTRCAQRFIARTKGWPRSRK